MAKQTLTKAGKSRKSADFLKEKKVRRTTGTCPMNPRHTFALTGNGLLNHLRTAHGA